MPPKAKFTSEKIIEAALEIVRNEGFPALTTMALGAKPGSSARPIFTVFQSKEEVRQAATDAAKALYKTFLGVRHKRIRRHGYRVRRRCGIYVQERFQVIQTMIELKNDLIAQGRYGKLNVNFMPIFLYEADTPSVYNKIRIMSFCIEAGG